MGNRQCKNDSWEEGKKQGEPYSWNSLLPEGRLQAAVQVKETQTESGSLAKLSK